MFIYAAFRYFGIFSERSVKDVLGWLVKFIGYYAVALMIAAVIFLPVIMTIFGTDRFQAENYVPLLYDKIYYEKYLGDLIGENMIQWGLPGILLLLWRVCLCFFQEEEVPGSEIGVWVVESVLAGAFCRACAQWFLLCVQQVDLGLWDDDRVYFCEGVS